jgi:F-type H+-transporting ATPase subunit epsilon
MAELNIVIVTPELTTVEQTADAVVLPMIDGERGILPGHAPMIGRLAPGELRIQSGNQTDRYYVEGGTVQIERGGVTVMTGRSIASRDVDLVKVREQLEQAQWLKPADSQSAIEKEKTIAQCQAQIRVAEKK